MKFRTKIEKLDTEEIVNSQYINWEYFKDSTILVTGATGLIGSQIIKAILYANETKWVNIKVAALVRNREKAEKIFSSNTKNLSYIVQDITEPIKTNIKPDFIIHTANGTSSKEFAEQPVETINSIVAGTKNILEYARKANIKGLVYLSSMEIYGKTDFNRTEPLKENEYGYTDILNTRNSYPIGKQLAENMCYAYAKEYNVPLRIARLSQTIGAGVDIEDNRVFAQFARNVVYREDIVLLTQGETTRSYTYITDAIAAIFTMLERGENGAAYNVTNVDTACSIREMAEMLCHKYTSSELKIEPQENKFYLDKVKLVLDTTKLESLNWEPTTNLEEMFNRLIQDFYLRKRNIVVNKVKIPFKKRFLKFFFDMTNDAGYKKLTILGKTFRWKKNPRYLGLSKGYQINPKKIVLYDNHAEGFCGNLKYIAQELLKQIPDAEIVWVDDLSATVVDNFPKEIRTVPDNTKEAFEEFATAKIWIASQRIMKLVRDGLEKKEGQYYLQTWHGSLGIKKVGFDIDPENEDIYAQLMKNDSVNLDYAISNSDFENNVYRSIFFGQGENVLLGHARNDIFFNQNSDIEANVRDSLNIDKNKKIILYVPTYRDDKDTDCYNMDYEKILSEFEKKLGSECVFFFFFYPWALNSCRHLFGNNPRIINGNKYDDIQELLSVSDVVITDYSSCIFDFMLTRKPGYIYASDIEKYNTKRGLYYTLETTPFPVATNTEEFINNINKFDYNNYKIKLEEFLKEKGSVDDGHSSERIAEFVKGLME